MWLCSGSRSAALAVASAGRRPPPATRLLPASAALAPHRARFISALRAWVWSSASVAAHTAPSCVRVLKFSLHDCRCSTASGTFLAGSSGMGHCRLRSSAVLSSPFSSSSCSFWLIDLQVSHGSNSCSGPPTCVRHFLERLLTTFQ